MSTQRLQKILADAGIASRRGAVELIASGRITVNGTTVFEPGFRADAATDRIAMDGTPAEIFERASELKGMGLTVPAATEIALALRARGVDIPESIYTINYLRTQLLALREGGGVC